MYLLFPISSALASMVIQIMLPMLIKFYMGGGKVIWNWKYYANYSKNIKYVTRMIEAR